MNAKQVIVMRTDLGMRKGKMIAQGAHASMKVLLDMMEVEPARTGVLSKEFKGIESKPCTIRTLDLLDESPVHQWLAGKFTKICAKVQSEAEMENDVPSSEARRYPMCID